MKQIKLITITLILCMFVGGASAGITYDAPTNTITVAWYTEQNPCGFEDLYDADVIGGWGVVSKFNNEQYSINCDVKFDRTYFSDTNKQIKFGNDCGFYILYGAYVKFGTLISPSKKLGNGGCDFIFYLPYTYSTGICIEEGGFIEAYNCNFRNAHHLCGGHCGICLNQTNITRFWNCLFSNMEGITISGVSEQKDVFFNCNMVTIRTGVALLGTFSNGVFNNLKIYESSWGMQFVGVSQDIRANNIILEEVAVSTFFLYVSSLTVYIIDGVCDWTFNFFFSPDAIFYRQYTFNLQTTPNAKITIMNHTDIVYQDYAYDNGTIDEQILTMGHYIQTTDDMLNSYNPYSIEIKKVGYHTYAQEFTLNEPIKWRIMLLPDRVQVGSKIIRPARRS